MAALLYQEMLQQQDVMSVVQFDVAQNGIVQFDIAQWCAWPSCHADREVIAPAPSLPFLTAMQRRRLSALARLCFHVFWQVIPEEQSCGLVFCSRHGEAHRTLEMLQGIHRTEPVSPTAFSHSVHNAIPALISIARRDITEQVSIAQQGQDGMAAAFLEAAMMLHDPDIQQVVVICADEALPELYRPLTENFTCFPWAAAFRLQRGNSWRLTQSSFCAMADPAENYQPAPLQFIAALEQGRDNFRLEQNQQCWTWNRSHA